MVFATQARYPRLPSGLINNYSSGKETVRGAAESSLCPPIHRPRLYGWAPLGDKRIRTEASRGTKPWTVPKGHGKPPGRHVCRYPLGPMRWVAAHLPSKRSLGSCLVGSSQKNPQHGPQASQPTSPASHRPPAPVSAAPWPPTSLQGRQAASSEHLHPARGRAPPFCSSVTKVRGCPLNST